MKNKPLLTTIIATVVIALLQFFQFSPDQSVASDIVAYADQARDAISMRNWTNLFSVLVGAGALVYNWLTGRSGAKILS